MTRKYSMEKLQKRNDEMYNNILSEISSVAKKASKTLCSSVKKNISEIEKLSNSCFSEIDRKIKREERMRKEIKDLIQKAKNKLAKLEKTDSLSKLKEKREKLRCVVGKKIDQIEKFKIEQEKVYGVQFGKISHDARKILKENENQEQ